jgi:hypothetical protein
MCSVYWEKHKWTRTAHDPLFFSEPSCRGRWMPGQHVRSMILPSSSPVTLYDSRGYVTLVEGGCIKDDTDEQIVSWAPPFGIPGAEWDIDTYEQLSEAVVAAPIGTHPGAMIRPDQTYVDWVRRECSHHRIPPLWTDGDCRHLMMDGKNTGESRSKHDREENEEDEEEDETPKQKDFTDLSTFDVVLMVVLTGLALLMVYFLVLYGYRWASTRISGIDQSLASSNPH